MKMHWIERLERSGIQVADQVKINHGFNVVIELPNGKAFLTPEQYEELKRMHK